MFNQLFPIQLLYYNSYFSHFYLLLFTTTIFYFYSLGLPKILIIIATQKASKCTSIINVHEAVARLRDCPRTWLRGLQLINDLSLKRVPAIKLWGRRADRPANPKFPTGTWRCSLDATNRMVPAPANRKQDHNSSI